MQLTPRLGIRIALALFVRFLFYALLFCCEAACTVLASLSPVAVIPFEYHQGLLWIQIKAEQADRPLQFLFDTGASVSVINCDTAKVLRLTGGRTIHVNGVNATAVGQWPVKLSAKAGRLKLPSKYLSLDLSQLALSCGQPVDGLLGADFLRGRVVEIDFNKHQLRILKSAESAKEDVILPIKHSGDCYVVSVTVNNQKNQSLRLDTGCASPLQWVTGDSHGSVQVTTPAIGLAACLIPQTKTTVSLGDLTFNHVATGMHDQAIFSGEAGLLGNGLLSRFASVTIDAKSKHLILSQK